MKDKKAHEVLTEKIRMLSSFASSRRVRMLGIEENGEENCDYVMVLLHMKDKSIEERAAVDTLFDGFSKAISIVYQTFDNIENNKKKNI